MKGELVGEIIGKICGYIDINEEKFLDYCVICYIEQLMNDYREEKIQLSLETQRTLLYSAERNKIALSDSFKHCSEYIDFLNDIFLNDFLKEVNGKAFSVDAFCLSKYLNSKSIEILEQLINCKDNVLQGKVFHLLAYSENVRCINILEKHSPIGYRLVPAGEFIFGSDNSLDEKYNQKVWLPSFYVAKYPVTEKCYNIFAKGDNDSDDGRSDSLNNDIPCHGVTWYQAEEYAKANNVSLPTEAQWEKAARGTDGRMYPWGNDFESCKANAYETENNTFTNVNEYECVGASPYGVVDCVGNCWEWTSSLYDKYENQKFMKSVTANVSGDRVLRGGAYDFDRFGVTCTNRYRCNPENGWDTHGFRVVINL